jgi:uncharacterized protein involved in response to NO
MRGDNLANTLFGLGLALSLGRLVGLERGWQERAAVEGSRIAGIRTFGLIGLLGGLWELLARGTGDVLLGIAFLAFVRLMVISHVAEARVSKDYGIKTLIAALITFVLGALALAGSFHRCKKSMTRHRQDGNYRRRRTQRQADEDNIPV